MPRLQAEFPANTNILYVDLRSAAQVASCKDERSLPGMVLNMKKPVVYVDQFGKRRRYNYKCHPYSYIRHTTDNCACGSIYWLVSFFNGKFRV